MIYCERCMDNYGLPLGRDLGIYRRCGICRNEYKRCQENTLLRFGTVQIHTGEREFCITVDPKTFTRKTS